MQSSMDGRRLMEAKPIVNGQAILGVLVYYHSLPDKPPQGEQTGSHSTGDTQGEIERVEQEITAVEEELRVTSTMLRREGFKDEAEIIGTHILILQDVSLREKLKAYINEKGVSAEEALVTVFDELKYRLLASENATTRDRADDIEELMKKYGSG